MLVVPADLAVALGLPGGTAEPVVAQAIAAVAAAARSAGKPMTSIVGTVEQARRAPRGGAVIYNLAHVLLRTLGELAEKPPSA